MNHGDLQATATQVRRDIVRMVHAVQSGHPGGSLGCTDLLVQLYFDTMNVDPSSFDMDGHGEDLFFLSNGHISPVWYSVLARRGYFPVSELATFRKLNSRLQGHPATEEGLPGIRVASGSLGQGLSVALGAAQVKKLAGEDTWVYSLHGDGELQEGQIWEAAMYAAHHKIDNILSFVDCNGQQIDGSTTTSCPWETSQANGRRLAGTCCRATATTSRTCNAPSKPGMPDAAQASPRSS